MMRRTRSFSFPSPNSTAVQADDRMAGPASSPSFAPAHSRESSSASSASTSSPITPTFSTRLHTRWPSSSSSLATSPDSPVNIAKSPLHDLVEDPAERDEGLSQSTNGIAAEPLCICDSTFCEHRRAIATYSSGHVTPVTSEWSPIDDCFDQQLPGERIFKRRKSGDSPTESLTVRLSRRWPTLSKRWTDKTPTTAVSNPSVRSAPPSRASSMRLSSLRHCLATHLEPHPHATPPPTPTDVHIDKGPLRRPRAHSKTSVKPLEIMIPESHAEDSAEAEEPISTPLLPPMMPEHQRSAPEQLQSPLQSPSRADPSATASISGSPAIPPHSPVLPTPPLSSKPSVSSIHPGRAMRSLQPLSDIPPMTISEATDPWAYKLGHANFHVAPEPYFPEYCDLQACKRLLDDWESARLEYMLQARRVSEHYGPTSQTYKFTAEKWAEIDAQWRTYHERANIAAQASGETTMYSPLAELQPLAKMPSLNDPDQPHKFPQIDETEIVGPMVQYAKLPKRPAKTPALLLKLFTDPASLLGGRSPFGRR